MLIGFETYRSKSDIATLAAIPEGARVRSVYLPRFGNQTSASTLVVVNYGIGWQTVTASAAMVDAIGQGGANVMTAQRTLGPFERLEAPLDQLFGFNAENSMLSYVRFEVDASIQDRVLGRQDMGGVFAYLESKTPDGKLIAVTPQAAGYSDISFSYLANQGDLYTGLTLVNPDSQPASISIDALDATGNVADSATLTLAANSRWSGLLTELMSETQDQVGGRVHITASSPILAIQLLGSAFGGLAVVIQGSMLTQQPSGKMVTAQSGGIVISDDGFASSRFLLGR